MKHVLEPIFECDFAEHSYGFRPGRGWHEAVQRVEQLLSQGHPWCVDLHFKSYFETIAHERLLRARSAVFPVRIVWRQTETGR